jgi:hypothetical protein
LRQREWRRIQTHRGCGCTRVVGAEGAGPKPRHAGRLKDSQTRPEGHPDRVARVPGHCLHPQRIVGFPSGMEDFLRVDGCAHAQQVRGQSFHSRLVVCPADQESHEGSTTPTVYGLIAIHGGNDGNDSVVTIMLVLVLVLRCSREGTHSASGSCAPSTRAKYVGVRLGRFHLGIGSILAEIYLCHACSDHEIEGGNARPAVRGARRERPEHGWVP